MQPKPMEILNNYFDYNMTEEPPEHRFHQKDKRILRYMSPNICPNVCLTTKIYFLLNFFFESVIEQK